MISFHDSECTDCLTKLSDIALGPYMYFGIIDDFDEQKDYGDFSDALSYDDILKKYHCIALPDIIINDWWDNLIHMKSYYEKYGRPETALSRWGTTLIPPESFDLFTEIIKTRTNERYLLLCETELTALLSLIKQAKCKNKFVIHYGV